MPKEERWIPMIVGGTDYEEEKVKPRRVVPMSGIANQTKRPPMVEVEQDVIDATHEWLSEYSSSIPEEEEVTWDYGLVHKMTEGTRVRQGQYVTEYRKGKKHQVYWVPC